VYVPWQTGTPVSQDKITFIVRVQVITLQCQHARHTSLHILAGEDFESVNTSNVA